jgi:endoglucanase
MNVLAKYRHREKRERSVFRFFAAMGLVLFLITVQYGSEIQAQGQTELLRLENPVDLWVSGSGKALMEKSDGTVSVIRQKTGEFPWSIILNFGGISLKKNNRYMVSFEARSVEPLRLETLVSMPVTPNYGFSGKYYFSLTGTYKLCRYVFTMHQKSETNGFLQFFLGNNDTGKVEIRNVSVKDLGRTEDAVISKNFPKPFAPAMKRGIQFGLQFAGPLEGAYGAELKEEYFNAIKSDGRFDSIRLPVWWEYHTQSTPPYTIDPEFMKRVDWTVSGSLSRGYYTILNMHWFRAFEKDPVRNKAQFLATWEQIAQYYKDYPDNLYFDILNEPNGNLDRYWNDYFPEAVRIIRKTNPVRTIIISGVFWANMDRISELVLPDDIKKDPNIIIQFHPYVPGEFCFQGSAGNGFEKMKNIRWTGTDTEKKRITGSMDKIQQWSARNNNVRLMNGEFTAHNTGGSLKVDRLRWIGFIVSECEKRNIPWNYYDFCEDSCRVYDIESGEWEKDLMNTLFRN